jgi:hypothetical protein
MRIAIASAAHACASSVVAVCTWAYDVFESLRFTMSACRRRRWRSLTHAAVSDDLGFAFCDKRPAHIVLVCPGVCAAATTAAHPQSAGSSIAWLRLAQALAWLSIGGVRLLSVFDPSATDEQREQLHARLASLVHDQLRALRAAPSARAPVLLPFARSVEQVFVSPAVRASAAAAASASARGAGADTAAGVSALASSPAGSASSQRHPTTMIAVLPGSAGADDVVQAGTLLPCAHRPRLPTGRRAHSARVRAACVRGRAALECAHRRRRVPRAAARCVGVHACACVRSRRSTR